MPCAQLNTQKVATAAKKGESLGGEKWKRVEQLLLKCHTLVHTHLGGGYIPLIKQPANRNPTPKSLQTE